MIATAAFAYVYFYPTIHALANRHVNRGGVFFVNLLAGWTIIGWFCTLIWAFDHEKEG